MLENRLQVHFKHKMDQGKKVFVAYIGAGCPGQEASVEVAVALAELGVDCIEFGLPFSDPYGDGAVNQAAAEIGIRNGVTVPVYLDLVRKIRARTSVPLVAFGYANPVWKFGVDRFAAQAADAGIDGLLLVDLPVEESEEVDAACRSRGLFTTYLTTPTTTPARLAAIARRAQGFVYHVSRTGVTGEQVSLSASLADEVRAVKALVKPPVVVGFGLSTPQQVREVCAVADGAVVGSAIVRRTLEDRSIDQVLSDVRAVTAPLIQAIA